ncbi:hypothetical protein [Halomonas sp. E14]|uniref:hypothetical protein n=1 Tax=Halomonas sp. E14 TaxID=3397245 RepID=UPI00403E595E
MNRQERSAYRRWTAWQATAFYLAMMCCLVLAVGWALKDRHARELAAARVNSLAHADLVAEWAKGAFTSTDNTLSGMANLFALALNDEHGEGLADEGGQGI